MGAKIVLLLLYVGLANCQKTCSYNDEIGICEGRNKSITWKCPTGFKVRAEAFWGRTDNVTCINNVPWRKLQNISCPGKDVVTSAAVEKSCNANVVAGRCEIQATTSYIGHDPCSGTEKYLKICTYCEPEGCDYNDSPATCEWQTRTLEWDCPVSQKPKVSAFWGRVPGDNTTCVDQVPSEYLQDLNCPGNDGLASEAVQLWCDQNAEDGKCRLKATNQKLKINGKSYEPCVGTFKYLKTCTECQAIGAKTLVLLDCTGSMVLLSGSYMPLLVNFLDAFFNFTSTDAFWATHRTYLEIIPFTTQLDQAVKVTVDYSDFASARTFRDADIEHVNEFKDHLENKIPLSRTNLGQVMQNVKEAYTVDGVRLVIMVSDFINIDNTPDMVTSAAELRDIGIHMFPVLLDKPKADITSYELVRLSTMDQVGIQISNGKPIPFQTIYDKLS